MKFLFARPEDWFIYSKRRHQQAYKNGWIGLYDVEALFDNMERACESLGVPYESRNIKPLTIVNERDTIFIGHHTTGKNKNTWHTKKGMVPDYLYFDKLGYSGWSSLAKEYNNDKVLNEIELQWIKDYVSKYISTNTSKIPQPASNKFPSKPYVLVLGQKPGDSVQKLAWIKTQPLSRMVVDAYKNTEYEVYTKPHPGLPNVKFSGKRIEGSIHTLIKNASAIYTSNSGSGFESLFHMKPVFVSGDCEYKWAAKIVKNNRAIVESVDLIHEPIDEEKVLKFLHYCFHNYFVHCHDLKEITKRIQKCIDEYEI